LHWTVLILNAAVEAELNALSADMRARFVRIARPISEIHLALERAKEIRP